MCVIVRFFDAEEGEVVSKFWDLCQVFEPSSDVESATARHLFELLTKSFEEYEIAFKNIIGFASDGASTMMGKSNSVASRFIEQCPGIYIFKCLCHSLHLCASNACKKLPRSCEDLARNIYGEFKNSAKRQHLFQKFQTFFEIDVHKILRPAQTRWLSLKAVVSRIIEQWPALELYFREQMLTSRLKSIEQITQALNNPLIKLLYLFLDFILPKFTELNELFQSSSVVVTSLHEKMCRSYQELLETYMSRDYIDRTDLSELDPCNKTHYLPPEHMYFGVEVRKMLDQNEIRNNKQLKSDFTIICVEFLVEGCSEIKKRFNFSNPILKLITNLNPQKAMLKKTRDLIPSLLPLMEALPRIASSNQHQIIDDEWRQLPYFELPANIKITDPIDSFWAKLMDCGEGDQGMSFKNVSKFVLNVISLPHSNADSERIFSHINLIKTKTRNNMMVSTVNGILLAKQGVKSNVNCTTYEPSQSEYDRLNKSLMYKRKTTSESTNKKLCDLYDDSDLEEFNSILMPNEEF
ncbi:SCAN domain-containing protein 3 [Bactrocera oleae]|uniref:SCAN domain-containing protein 3 n=1 Tax=Bactrocera oleae TaxID=104688 RepID=UPI00387E5F9A